MKKYLMQYLLQINFLCFNAALKQEKRMNYEKIKEKLTDRNLRVVAERIGMEHSKLWRLATGRTQTPLKEDLQAIATYLRK